MKEQNRESEPQRLGPGVEVSGASYGTGSNSVASAISPNKVLWGCWSLSGFHCPGTGSTKCSAGDAETIQGKTSSKSTGREC